MSQIPVFGSRGILWLSHKTGKFWELGRLGNIPRGCSEVMRAAELCQKGGEKESVPGAVHGTGGG